MASRSSLILLFAMQAVLGQAAWTSVSLHPSGATESKAFAANGAKQGGYAKFPSALPKAGIWTKTAASWLDITPTGVSDCRVLGMSGSQQVGYGASKGARWLGTSGSFTDLTPSGASFAVVTSTDGSQQAGYARITALSTVCAGYWSGSSGSWVNLALNWQSSRANGVAGGEQVGHWVEGNLRKACRWLGTPGSQVVLHPATASQSDCLGTDGTRQVGYVNFGGGNDHAALWNGNALSFVDLHPSGAEVSLAYAVNGQNQVGYYRPADGDNRACYWQGNANTMVDLHDFLPPQYVISEATSITFDGPSMHVVGNAYNSDAGRWEAVLWTNSGSTDFEFALNKTQVAGQNSVQGTVSLSGPASSNTVFTTYDNSSLVNTPPSVTILAGTSLRNFQITVTAVTAPINTTVYAKRGSVVKSRPLTLVPLIPTAMSFTPSLVTGGQSTSARVVINGVAGPGGRLIAIFDNSPFATVPATITVPPGASSHTFSIATLPVTSQKVVTVTARVSAGEKSATFRINP